MGSLLDLASNVKYWPCVFSFLFTLLHVTPTLGGSSECSSEASPHASTVLLQRGAQLQTLTDAATGNAPKELRRLDHDGLEWQGGNASKSTVASGGGGGKMSLSHKAATITSVGGRKSAQTGAGGDNPADRTITFVTVRDAFFDTNLARSDVWIKRGELPHQWLLIDNWQNTGISYLYAQAQKTALNDLLVFLHSDVWLPDEWYSQFMQKLQQIESVDPNWGVLGTAGVPLGWIPNAANNFKIASSITDCFDTFHSGIDGLEVQSFDEHLLVLRRNYSPEFDEKLPGFDLYGTDIVLSTRQVGKKAHLLNVLVKHKTVDEQGEPYNGAIWKEKFKDPSFQGRAHATVEYLQTKWCSSGLLPVYGTAFDIEACQ